MRSWNIPLLFGMFRGRTRNNCLDRLNQYRLNISLVRKENNWKVHFRLT